MTDPIIPLDDRRVELIATPGQPSFQFNFDGVATADDIRVYRNGEEITAFTLTAATKTVTPDDPVDGGDIIVIEGLLDIKRLFEYPRSGNLETRRLNPEMNFFYRVLQELRRDINRSIVFNKAQIGASNILPLFEQSGLALVTGPNGIEVSVVNVGDLDAALTAAAQYADDAAQAVAATEGVRDETETVRDEAIAARDLTVGYRDEAISARDAAQAAAAGMKWRDPVVVATTGDISLSGTQTINGVAVIAGDRVLVKNQSTAAQNGVYVVAAGAWSRAADCDNWSEIVSQVVTAQQGTTDPDTPYICTNNPGGTLGSTAVTWVILPIPLVDGAVSTTAKIADNIITHQKLNSAVTAVQSDMESASANDKFVTPGRAKYHPGVAKAWAYVTYSGGVPTLAANTGVASITDLGVGYLRITFSTAFSSVNYAVNVSAESGAAVMLPQVDNRTATYVDVYTRAYSTGNPVDPSAFNILCFGDQ